MSDEVPSPVVISYADLKSAPDQLQSAIETAFGSHSKALGIIIVKDLPADYPLLREKLLRFAYKFASLPESVKEKYVDPTTRYSFGWSHGKEIMNGKPDTLKGSYYANPLADDPKVSEENKKAYPEYYGENIWPENNEKGVEGFEQAFKSLGQLIYQIGCELATACQPFASPHLEDTSLSLQSLISQQTTKARLLHYFPPSPGEAEHSASDEPVDSWCGFHLDHSLLTGLCSALYLKTTEDGDPIIVPSPSPEAGLYIRSRGGELTKATIPADCLAFQTGEALELATGGKLRATPHCVRAGVVSKEALNVSRETFALFMQPDVDQMVGPNETFGQFSKRIFDTHY
ncbi:Clavaminate synthase-like protein [Schizopora paradoxa]|uniref:Clavaminate synthase-like protein n=1 Tax=Schizopora paradoxa TaxID=27342 RepID=A0A0H2S7R5_9AGAM|nr:Clavaminate synthase-like protein [Schizopora paradoxa]